MDDDCLAAAEPVRVVPDATERSARSSPFERKDKACQQQNPPPLTLTRHFDPALRTLSDAARRLWGDRQERHRALDAIIAAYDADDEPALRAAIQRVDDAVVQGLRALELPRGPVRLVDFRDVPRSWQGIKEPGCHIIISARLARLVARTHQLPDDLLRKRHLGFEFTTRQRLHVGMRANTIFLTERQAELDVDRGNLRYRWEQALAGHYG